MFDMWRSVEISFRCNQPLKFAINVCQETEVASPKEKKDTVGLFFKAADTLKIVQRKQVV